MFEKIMRWFRLGLWNREMVNRALEKGLLTLEEYGHIVNQEEWV